MQELYHYFLCSAVFTSLFSYAQINFIWLVFWASSLASCKNMMMCTRTFAVDKVKIIAEETKIMVLRIRRGAESMLINALTTMKTIGKEPIKIVTLQTTGTIR